VPPLLGLGRQLPVPGLDAVLLQGDRPLHLYTERKKKRSKKLSLEERKMFSTD
jgi:hypothetical protein